MNDRGLTLAQRMFALTFIATGNVTRAYRAAFPACRSDEAASANGARLLKNDRVQAFIRQQRERILHESDGRIADRSEICRALTAIMRSDKGTTIHERSEAAAVLAAILGVNDGIRAERLKLDAEWLDLKRAQLRREKITPTVLHGGQHNDTHNEIPERDSGETDNR